MALTNAEKQACYRERHLGVDGEKVASGSLSTLAPGPKMGCVARHRGYTITDLLEELAERAEQLVTARLSSRGSRPITMPKDSEPIDDARGPGLNGAV
jgi:hypothetical protein